MAHIEQIVTADTTRSFVRRCHSNRVIQHTIRTQFSLRHSCVICCQRWRVERIVRAATAARSSSTPPARSLRWWFHSIFMRRTHFNQVVKRNHSRYRKRTQQKQRQNAHTLGGMMSEF